MNQGTTWRKKLTDALNNNGESWRDIESITLSHEQLDKLFDDGLGVTEGAPFTAWTFNHVYFPSSYDGAEDVAFVSRNPDGKPTKHIGGGGEVGGHVNMTLDNNSKSRVSKSEYEPIESTECDANIFAFAAETDESKTEIIERTVRFDGLFRKIKEVRFAESMIRVTRNGDDVFVNDLFLSTDDALWLARELVAVCRGVSQLTADDKDDE